MTTVQDHQPQTFAQALSQLRGAQKPGHGVPAYTRWVNRRIARIAAALSFRMGLSANAVTAISGLVSLAGMVVLVFMPVRPTTGLLAAALLALGYILDSADGQVARLSRSSSPAGEWLDHVVDAIRTPLIHASVLIALFRDDHVGMTWVQYVAVAFMVLSAGHFMSQILADQLTRASSIALRKEETTGNGLRKSLILLPTDTGVVCWLFVLWGFPMIFGLAYGVLLATNLVHAATSMYRKYRSLAMLRR